jgi:hypothetical protein
VEKEGRKHGRTINRKIGILKKKGRKREERRN